MDNAFLSCLVNSRLSLPHNFIYIVTVCLFCCFKLFFKIFKCGFYRFVSKPSDLALFCTFFSRFMGSQLGLTPYIVYLV